MMREFVKYLTLTDVSILKDILPSWVANFQMTGTAGRRNARNINNMAYAANSFDCYGNNCQTTLFTMPELSYLDIILIKDGLIRQPIPDWESSPISYSNLVTPS